MEDRKTVKLIFYLYNILSLSLGVKIYKLKKNNI